MRKSVWFTILFLYLFVPQIRATGFDGGVVVDYHQLPYRSMTSFGLHTYIQFDKFTINYQFSLGTSSTGGFHIHTPAGLAAGVFLVSRIKPDSVAQFGRRLMGIVGLLSMGIPEGCGIYLSQREKYSTHLIINPLGFEYWKRKDPYVESWRVSGTIMFRLRRTIPGYKFLYIAPQAGFTWMYADGQVGIKAGLTFGYHSEEE